MRVRTPRDGYCSGALTWSQALALTALSLFAACGESTQPVTGPASIQLSSPIDTVLAVGRTAQLAATPRDQAGNTLSGVTLNWSSSTPTVATVSANGLVSAIAAGTTTISASAVGPSGPVAGTLRLRVVAADLAQVQTLASDAYLTSLIAGLTAGKRFAVQTALAGCATATGSGNVLAIVACVSSLRSEIASATDGTDRALLSVIALFGDQIERLLNL